MRFMFIVKSAHSGPPTPELIEAMHKLADRESKAGRMLDNGGLMPVSTGAQVRLVNGKLSVVMAHLSKPRKSSVAMPYSSSPARKRPSPRRKNSCSSTRT